MSSPQPSQQYQDLLLQIQTDKTCSQSTELTKSIKQLEEDLNNNNSNNQTNNNYCTKSEISKLYLALGESQFMNEMDDLALENLENSILNDPTNARAFFYKGLVLCMLNRMNEAKQLLEHAVELDGTKHYYWLELGRCCNNLKEYDRALECFKKCLEVNHLNSNNKDNSLVNSVVDILYNMGVKLMTIEKDHYDKALQVFKEAGELDNKDLQIQGKIVQCLEALGQEDERDEKIKEIYERNLKEEFGKNQIRFCRDQFPIHSCVDAQGRNVHVFVYEYFKLVGDMAVKYVFAVTDENQKENLFRISLGSYTFTNALCKEQNPNVERMYHLDGYFGSMHKTYGFFVGTEEAPSLSYDELKKRVIGILTGTKNDVISSSTFN
ncbi:hypothetical protein ABK040_015389 [Willaertia magna]